jgi:ribosome biogenesis GTPase A
MMQENLKLVDLVIELVDARVPLGSKNPDVDTIIGNKPRVLVLNKSDLADIRLTEEWLKYFRNNNILTETINSKEKSSVKRVVGIIEEACKEKIQRDRKKGILNRPLRAMIVGIPNVGKSTFINTLAGKASAKTGDKPGVTKGKQWIRLHKQVELLDTPGILWPKFEDPTVGMHLAWIGSVKEEILNTHELCARLLPALEKLVPGCIGRFYAIENVSDPYMQIEEIALIRKALKQGGQADVLRASAMILDEFRGGKIGQFTLEIPPQV